MNNANFIAIDFETATPKRMPCQIGLVVVKEGVIVKKINELIQPPQNKYSVSCTKVHGITPEHTLNSPTFDILWDKIKSYFDKNFIVAHNIDFDYDVLEKALSYYNIQHPIIMGCACTYQLSETNLEEACYINNIPLPSHHDAACDAEACARLFLKYLDGELYAIDRSSMPKQAEEQTEHIPSTDEFRNEVNRRNGRIVEREEKTIFDYYMQFITEQGKENSWSENTYKRHKTTMNHLKKFAPNLTFADLTHEGLSQLVDYLMNVEIDDEVGMKNRTAKKYINLTKWFLRWAADKGINKELAFMTFKEKLKTIPSKVIYLEWDELIRVYNSSFPDEPHLEIAKDVFCFQCFTSLRYSDVKNLKRADVFDGYITTTTIKTDEPLKIELNKYSKTILDKYKDIKGIYALPVPVNQRMNKYIKEVCAVCEVNEPVCITYYKGSERIDEIHPKHELIGTHCGRKTFICNALMLGIAPNIVMKWTGHRDYKSMKPYIDIADKVKQEAMTLFNR